MAQPAIPRLRLRGPARVLIVSADQPLARIVQLTLNHGVYTSLVTSTEDAQAEIDRWKPHLAIVDIDQHDGNGLALLRRPGHPDARLPFIALTQRGDLKLKLEAFAAGVDDIVTIPVTPEELVARCLALMRRTYGEAVPFIPVIEISGIKIDLLNQEVRVGTSRLKLSPIEQTLLYFLASNPGKTVTREEILDSVWGADYVAESNLVDRHVRNLRVKLK